MLDKVAVSSALNLEESIIPRGKPNRSGGIIIPKFITIHNTSNTGKGADARAHARFVTQTGFYMLANGKRNNVSWHFTVDDQRVIKHLPANEHAIHAGKGNSRSVGIEVCMHHGIDQDAANRRAATLAAALVHDLGLDAGDVVPHRHWTGKPCPTLLLRDWEAFTKSILELRTKMPGDDLFVLSESEGAFFATNTAADVKSMNAGIELDDTTELDHEPIDLLF